MNNEVMSREPAQVGRWAFHWKQYWANQPMVIRAGASAWPALSRWNAKSLETLLGDRSVVVAWNAQGVFDPTANAPTGPIEDITMPFLQASRLISSDEGAFHYIQQTDLDTLDALRGDVDRPHVLGASKMILKQNIWYGGKGCKSPLHYDRADNFLCQVLGRKQLHLFAPSNAAGLYPTTDTAFPHMSQIDVFNSGNVDRQRFPRFSDVAANGYTVTIGPGDMLYIPIGWWHAVESLDISISVNIWWQGYERHVANYLRHLRHSRALPN